MNPSQSLSILELLKLQIAMLWTESNCKKINYHISYSLLWLAWQVDLLYIWLKVLGNLPVWSSSSRLPRKSIQRWNADPFQAIRVYLDKKRSCSYSVISIYINFELWWNPLWVTHNTSVGFDWVGRQLVLLFWYVIPLNWFKVSLISQVNGLSSSLIQEILSYLTSYVNLIYL